MIHSCQLPSLPPSLEFRVHTSRDESEANPASLNWDLALSDHTRNRNLCEPFRA